MSCVGVSLVLKSNVVLSVLVQNSSDSGHSLRCFCLFLTMLQHIITLREGDFVKYIIQLVSGKVPGLVQATQVLGLLAV